MPNNPTPSLIGDGISHGRQHDNAKAIADLLLTDENLLKVIDNRHYDHSEIRSAGDKNEDALIAALRKRGLWRRKRVGKKPSVPLLNAAATAGSMTVVKFLLNFISEKDARWSAMECAIKNQRLDVIDLLIEHGERVEDQIDALKVLVLHGHTKVVEYFLNLGIDAKTMVPEQYDNVCLAAIHMDRSDTLELLLQRGIDSEKSTMDLLLGHAVRGRKLGAIEMLVRYGADVNNANVRRGALVDAIRQHAVEMAELLIALGADLEKYQGTWYEINRPVQVAACWNHIGLLKLMIVHGVDLDPKDPKGTKVYETEQVKTIEDLINYTSNNRYQRWGSLGGSPLQIAAARGYFELVRLLLKYNTDTVSEALVASAASSDQRILDILIAHGANVRFQWPDGHTALSRAIAEGCDSNAALFLQLIFHDDGRCDPRDLIMPLRAAVIRGRQQWVASILALGADPHAIASEGGWPLITVAAYQGYTGIVDLLLSHGVDPNAEGGTPELTPLQAAASQSNVGTVQSLLTAGADVHARSSYWAFANSHSSWKTQEETILGTACRRSCVEVVKLLVEKGADVHDSGPFYGTPLRSAVEQGDVELGRYLVACGADINKGDDAGFNPMQAAIARDHVAMVDYFLELGADAIGPGSFGLHIAAQHAGRAMVEKMIALGADVNEVAESCGSPLQASASGPYSATTNMEILLEHGADVNAIGGIYGTALQAAVASTHDNQVDLLLRREGIDVNIRGGKYGSALDATDLWEPSDLLYLRYYRKKIVKSLIAAGATKAREFVLVKDQDA